MSYSLRKAAQVLAAFILHHQRKNLDNLKAIKLLALADQESVRRAGFPMLDDEMVSMDHGPVNSRTYDYIKGEVQEDADWSFYIKTGVSKKGKPQQKLAKTSKLTLEDLDELSDFELQCIQDIWEKYGALETFSLAEETHKATVFPAWKKPAKVGTSAPLPYEDIINSHHAPKAAKSLIKEYKAFKKEEEILLACRKHDA